MRCPKCRTLTLPPARTGDAASLVRCPRCPAAWVARPGDDGPGAVRPPPLTGRGPLIIEGQIAAPAAQARRRFGARRSGLAAGAVMVALALAAALAPSPDVAARPEVAGIEAAR